MNSIDGGYTSEQWTQSPLSMSLYITAYFSKLRPSYCQPLGTTTADQENKQVTSDQRQHPQNVIDAEQTRQRKETGKQEPWKTFGYVGGYYPKLPDFQSNWG